MNKDIITTGLEYIKTLDVVLDQLENDIKELKKKREEKKKERSQFMSDLLEDWKRQ